MTTKQWMPPKYWQDFEQMCLRLYAAQFRPQRIEFYGRAGQAQHGVDIAACSVHREWVGIQCKLKTELLGSALTETQVEEAYKQSKAFRDPLAKLFIATTCVRDTATQDVAAKVSTRFTSKYPVQIIFWEDIEDYLESLTEVARRFYPEMFPADVALIVADDGDLSITLPSKDWSERLERFLGHPSFRSIAGAQFCQLTVILSEIIDNMFNPRKGGATRVIVDLSGTLLTVRDDGKSFDIINDSTELLPDMRGLRAVRRLLETAGSELVHIYTPRDPSSSRFNHNEFEIRARSESPTEPCSASGPTRYLMQRVAAYEFVDQLSIPSDCETFTLRLFGTQYFNHSAASELIGLLLRRLARGTSPPD